MPMPPYVDPALPDPRKRTGLLGGLQSFGGLLGRGLRGAGRNFDRNAIGGIDQAMGTDFTNDMRRNLRANAVMSLGQMLATQGRTPIQEGLQRGQQGIYGAWKAGRERTREDETRNAMAQMAQEMTAGAPDPAGVAGTAPGGVGAPGAAPVAPDPATQLLTQAQKYRSLGAKLAALGHDKAAEPYYRLAEKYEERADKLRPVPVGQPIATVQNGQRVMMQPMSDGKHKLVEGFAPESRKQVVDLNDRSIVADLDAPNQPPMTKGIGPDTTARLGQEQTQFSQRFPLWERETAAHEMGSRASMMGAGASARNAGTAAARESREAAMEAGGKPLSAESAKVGAIATTMVPELQQLRKALEEGGRMAAMGIKTGLDPALRRLAENAADKVGRLRSGGAVNPNEEARFMAQIARWSDAPFGASGGALEAIDGLIEEARMVSRGIDPKMLLQGGRNATPPAATVPAVGGMFNGQKVTSVQRIP